jgi:hypothetical protein
MTTQTIIVNGIEVPDPLDSLEGMDIVYIADVTDKENCFKLFCDVMVNKRYLDDWLKKGLLYATKEDAIKRAEAMLKFEVAE